MQPICNVSSLSPTRANAFPHLRDYCALHAFATASFETPLQPPGTPASIPLLPMMTARRLDPGTRLALQAALAIQQRHPASALVFSSRHGEIQRTHRILQSLAARNSVSPADFAASVHNTAVGQFTITAALPLPASSVSAGKNSFLHALHEVRAFFSAGHSCVLHVDFENTLPSVFHSSDAPCTTPYAAAFLWEKPASDTAPAKEIPLASGDENLPLALAFLLRHNACRCTHPRLS